MVPDHWSTVLKESLLIPSVLLPIPRNMEYLSKYIYVYIYDVLLIYFINLSAHSFFIVFFLVIWYR